MSPWQIITAIAVGLVAAAYALHRLALYLERAGYMYYLKDRFAHGATRGFLGFQEELEPGVKHVIEVQDDAHLRELESANWNKWLADLLAAAARDPHDHAALRQILAAAERDGLDWRRLYAAARRMDSSSQLDFATRLPESDKVAPPPNPEIRRLTPDLPPLE